VPATEVIYYQEAPGDVPVRDWLLDVGRTHGKRAMAECLAVIGELQARGHELRRPKADILRDGIHELRARSGTLRFRILYFFHGRRAAVLAHALTKKGARVPAAAIDLAVRRKAAFQLDPKGHTAPPPEVP
jgi:phage-related protein